MDGDLDGFSYDDDDMTVGNCLLFFFCDTYHSCTLHWLDQGDYWIMLTLLHVHLLPVCPTLAPI